jgi:hypothetical protein
MMRTVIWLLIGVAVVAVVWIAAGRHVSLLLDRLVTGPAVSQPMDPLVYTGGGFDIAGKTMTFAETNNLRGDTDAILDSASRVVFTAGHQAFTMGPLTVASPNGRPDFEFTPEPGDQVSFTASKSLLPWPTPFEFKMLGGSSPWLRQYVYYRLTWKKSSGAQLEMLWRYERLYYSASGWTEPEMTWMNSQTGLLSVKMRSE